MRDWRKLYKGIRSSDKLLSVSCEAKWLYVLLLSAQDDAGRYPWTPSNIRQLVSGTTEWDIDAACRYMSQLVATGLITEADGFAHVAQGKKFNGNPNNNRKPLYYESSSGTPVATRCDTSAHVALREEKIREDTPSDASRLSPTAESSAASPPPKRVDGTHQDRPEWFQTLIGINPGVGRSGVKPDDDELIAWVTGKKFTPEQCEEVATYIASAWHAKLRSRSSIRHTFQNLLNMRREPRYGRASTGRVNPPADDELTVAHNR